MVSRREKLTATLLAVLMATSMIAIPALAGAEEPIGDNQEVATTTVNLPKLIRVM